MNARQDRRHGDFEMQQLRIEVDNLTENVNALRAELKEMMSDYNTGVGILRWIKWIAAIGTGFVACYTAVKGWK